MKEKRRNGYIRKDKGFDGIGTEHLSLFPDFKNEVNKFGRKVLVAYSEVMDHRGRKATLRREVKYL